MLVLSAMLLNIFILLHFLGLLCGAEMSPLYKLHKRLREGYDPHIRPVKDPRVPTNVTVDFFLFSVEEVNEASETLTTFGSFNITWYDEWLRWNISEHANIQRIYIPLHRVWTPDLVVSNNVEKISMLSDTTGLISVTNTGFVSWQRTMRQITKCSMDMSKFPVDKQTCILRLAPWVSDNSDVYLLGGSVISDYNFYKSRREWRETEKRIKTKTHMVGENSSMNEIWFSFTFQRNPLNFVITRVLPVFLLSVLNLSVFLLPPESGEKISLCISVFLSYVLILTDTNEVLPDSFDTLAVFRVYLLTMLFVKVITVLATVAILKRFQTEIRTRQMSPASSQGECEGHTLVQDERKGRSNEWKLSADGLNTACFSAISLIMIATTSACLYLLLII